MQSTREPGLARRVLRMAVVATIAGCGAAPPAAESVPGALQTPSADATGARGTLIASAGAGGVFGPDPAAAEGDGPAGIVWKAAVMAGDGSIVAFDNARDTVYGMFLAEGVLPEHAVQLSRARRREPGVRDLSVESLLNGMLALDVGAVKDGCAVFMTSHGSPSGFQIEGRTEMSPSDLDHVLDEACGDSPTVVIVSGCFTGVFIEPLAAPNRIVLTAARSDRTSFGCAAGATYTYWDGCFIERFPSAATWEDLYASVSQCVADLEGGWVVPSEPQAYFGADVRDLAIFYRK